MVFNGALPGDMKRTRAENFTFIGLEANLDMDPARFLVAPYPSHEHHDSYQPQPSLGGSMFDVPGGGSGSSSSSSRTGSNSAIYAAVAAMQQYTGTKHTSWAMVISSTSSEDSSQAAAAAGEHLMSRGCRPTSAGCAARQCAHMALRSPCALLYAQQQQVHGNECA
jgi:hypothetical protein